MRGTHPVTARTTNEQDKLNESQGPNFRHAAHWCFEVVPDDFMTEDVVWAPGANGPGDTCRNDVTLEMRDRWQLPDGHYAYNHDDYHYWPNDKAMGVGVRN